MSSDGLDRVFIGEPEGKESEGDEAKNEGNSHVAGAESQDHDWAIEAP